MTTRLSLLLFLPFFLYLLALNPYITPETYDNLIYYGGAVSLIHEGIYQYNQSLILTWPPGLSVILAIPFGLGFESIWAAKGVILLMTLGTMLLYWKFLKLENRPYFFLGSLISVMSPFFLQASSRILSEMPYTCFSMLFLFLFYKINRESQSKWSHLFLAGIVLSLTILIRLIGVVLVIPVALHLIVTLYNSKKLTVQTIKIGSLLIMGVLSFLSWRGYIYVQSGFSSSAGHEAHNFFYFDLFESLFSFLEYCFGAHLIFTDVNSPFARFLVILTGLFLLLGIIKQWKNGSLSVVDSYVISYFLLISSYKYKIPRFILPVAPFLISYFIDGLQILFKVINLTTLRKKIIERTTIVAWISLLFLYDLGLLAVGNQKTYNGLSLLASPTPESFYRGHWLDLYQASRLTNQPAVKGAILTQFSYGDKKYIHFFSNREVVSHAKNQTIAFILSNMDLSEQKNLTKIGRFGDIWVYQMINHDRIYP